MTEICPYCTTDSDGYVLPLEKNGHAFIRFGMNGWEIDISAKGWHGSAKIMYCPMCGRKLRRKENRMAEFQEVAKQFKRLCDSQEFCDACIMNENRGRNTCYRFMMEKPMKAEEVVMEWAAEHPLKTNGMKFREVFGDHVMWENVEEMEAWLNAEYKRAFA